MSIIYMASIWVCWIQFCDLSLSHSHHHNALNLPMVHCCRYFEMVTIFALEPDFWIRSSRKSSSAYILPKRTYCIEWLTLPKRYSCHKVIVCLICFNKLWNVRALNCSWNWVINIVWWPLLDCDELR